MHIKVCGLRDPENISAIEQLDIDWMGFIFYPESPRFVTMIPSHAGIMPDYSSFKDDPNRRGTVKKHDKKRVGVFVDEMPQSIVTRVYNYDLDVIQLHGDESAIMIDNLRRTLDPDIRPGVKIMKTLSIHTADDVLKYKAYEGVADYFLFDNACREKGGSGEHFDWSVLEQYTGDTPFLLSGGIGPDDVDDVRHFHHPALWGVDLNSKFETEPAIKDVEKLRAFIEKLKNDE